MREEFVQRIISYIEEKALIGEGVRVFAGVSGGADSLCLLYVLSEYKNTHPFELRVIHVEHGIRGEESVEDARYVQAVCEELAVPCEVVSVDVPQAEKELGLSLEEAARVLRYEQFQAIANQSGDLIALAHHKEDQAETLLWQMIRGSDLKGLGAMRPKRDCYIRPLLSVSRAEIEAYLTERGITWRTDSTNEKMDATRNRMRLEVVPVLRQLNAGSVEHLCDMADRMQRLEDYMEQQTDEIYGYCVLADINHNKLTICEKLREYPEILTERVFYRALTEVAGSAKDIGQIHVKALRELLSRQVGRRLDLPYGVRAHRTYEGIVLCHNSQESKKVTGDAQLSEKITPQMVSMQVIERAQVQEIPKKKYTKCFDYDKIKDIVKIRYPKEGDWLTIDEAGHTQKLKRFFVNEKIPAEERSRTLLLADGDHVIWIIGHRISSFYKVDEHTTRVLKVQIDGGIEDER